MLVALTKAYLLIWMHLGFRFGLLSMHRVPYSIPGKNKNKNRSITLNCLCLKISFVKLTKYNEEVDLVPVGGHPYCD